MKVGPRLSRSRARSSAWGGGAPASRVGTVSVSRPISRAQLARPYLTSSHAMSLYRFSFFGARETAMPPPSENRHRELCKAQARSKMRLSCDEATTSIGMNARHFVFVAGGTGYVGRAVIPRLLARGHAVRALARPGSAARVPAGCEIVLGNALVKQSFAESVAACDTFLQLVGVAHPSPSKAEQFRTVDLASARASAEAAAQTAVRHFVYV